jgi:hypothetical protein
MSRYLRVRTFVVTGAIAAALAAPAPASAGVLVADATGCESQAFSQPFLPWADPASYTLQPGGDFEAGSRKWFGGTVVSGNEPWSVGAASDSGSLHLSAGNASVSPSICVGIEHPDIRFFAKGSSPAATLRVEVLFEDAAGNVQSAPIGAVTGTGDWALTPPFAIVANLLPLLPGSHTAVAFKLTAVTGCWKVDDFYVDPFARY